MKHQPLNLDAYPLKIIEKEFHGLSALEASAIRLHEIYKCLLMAGFTSEEALSLIAKMSKRKGQAP